MQSTLKRESKVPEIVVGEAFGGVIMPAFFHQARLWIMGYGGAYGYPISYGLSGLA